MGTPNHGHLVAVGPTSSDSGFPVWYKDDTGLRLAPCLDPKDANCPSQTVAGAMPDPSKPVSFPDNFPKEFFSQGITAVIVSGGNVDAKVLADLIAGRETRVGRRVRLRTRVPNRPGGLAGLLETVAAAGGNVLEIGHVRDDANLPLAQTGVELLVELRGTAHADALAKDLDAAGYPSRHHAEEVASSATDR